MCLWRWVSFAIFGKNRNKYDGPFWARGSLSSQENFVFNFMLAMWLVETLRTIYLLTLIRRIKNVLIPYAQDSWNLMKCIKISDCKREDLFSKGLHPHVRFLYRNNQVVPMDLFLIESTKVSATALHLLGFSQMKLEPEDQKILISQLNQRHYPSIFINPKQVTYCALSQWKL